MPTSRPIRCQRLYRQAYCPEGSVRTPYGEAAADVLRVALEHHPHAKADIVEQHARRAPAGHHDLALVVQLPAFGTGPHDGWEVVDARRRVR